MKITKSTFKSFIKKNEGKLFIKISSDFNGCIDGVEYYKDADFKPINKTGHESSNNMGYDGIWLVGSSRDYFEEYEDADFKGIRCYNSCGSFIVAIKC